MPVTAIEIVLAHEVVHLGPVALPSSHGFTVALLISIGAAGVALAFSLAIPRAPRTGVDVTADGPVGVARSAA